MRASRVSRVLALCFATLAGAVPANAAAAAPKQRIAILPAISGDASATTSASAIYTELARDIALRPSLEAIPYDELLTEGDEPLAAAALACGSDTGCLAARFERAGVALGLRVAIALDISPPLAIMVLIDAGKRAPIGESIVELDTLARAPERLRTLAAKLLDAAGHPLGGRLTITFSPPDAELTLDHQPLAHAGTGKHVLTIPAGRHELTAKKSSHAPQTAIAVVTAGTETAIALALPPEDEGELTTSPWFWATLAGAAAAIGTATVIVLATDPFSKKIGCLCLQVPNGSCTCPGGEP